MLLVFALALLVLTKSEPLSWADASRLGTIQALVEDHSFALHEDPRASADTPSYLWQGDKVLIQGRYYSHQPPMMALLGAVPYAALHAAGRAIDAPGTYRILTWLLVGLPMLAGLAALGRLLRRFGASDGEAAWLLAAAAFGTLALPYSLVLNQHGLAAGLVLLAAEAVWLRRAALAGLLLALATTVDLTAVFFAMAFVVPLVWRPSASADDPASSSGFDFGALLPYTLAALPVLALHFGVNQAIVGDFKPLGLHTEAFEYPLSPFVLMNLTGGGDTGPTGSAWAYARGALIGQSGLFSLSPILLLALWMGVTSWRKAPSARPLLAGVVLGALGIVVFYLTASRNFGGSSFGMRWFSVFAPLLLLLPAPGLGAAERTAGRARFPALVFAVLLVWSTLAASLGAAQPWAKFHWRFEDSPEGMVALPSDPRPGRLEFLADEWRRITQLEEVFTETRMDALYQKLLDQHRKLYLRPLPGVSEELRRAWITEGMIKLQRAVNLLDEVNSTASSRPVGHFWLGKFHAALGERTFARREYEITLTLAPSFAWAKKALEDLK